MSDHKGIRVLCPPSSRTMFIIHTTLFLSAIILNILVLRKSYPSSCQFGQDLREHIHGPNSQYPPVHLTTKDPTQYEAELGAPSDFKGHPRKELDAAWNSLVDMPMILANEETLQSFDPTSKPSKGTNGHYYATVEVFHQLHCLDITRKFIWRNRYNHDDTFQDPPEMVWEHVDHCIDLLRQVLMCHSDLGLIFYTDVGSKQPVARVSTPHMCRNFSQVKEWVNEHDAELGVFAEERRRKS